MMKILRRFPLFASMLALLSVMFWASAPIQAQSGVVVGWGRNDFGQINIPANLSNVAAVAAGARHSVALRGDGTVIAWGLNDLGEINVPSGLKNVIAISAGDWHNLALKNDGTVVAWGDNRFGQSTVPIGLSNIVAIAAGDLHSLALKADGIVVGWGYNVDGQANVPVGLANVVGISAQSHSLALRVDGTVVAWGRNEAGQATVPTGLSNVVAISAGGAFSLALKSDGSVAAWGDNQYGQLNVPSGLTGVAGVAASAFANVALKADGSVVTWGRNDFGQLGVPAGLTNVLKISQIQGDHNLVIRAVPPPPPPPAPCIDDDFTAVTLDTTAWETSIPFSQSEVFIEDGHAVLISRGGLDARPSFPDSVEIQCRFRFAGANDHFRIVFRSDLSFLGPFRGKSGMIVVLDPGGEIQIGEAEVSSLAVSRFPFQPNTDVDLRIADDGRNVALFLNDFVTPVLTAASSFRTGNRVAFYNRELPGTRVEIDYLRVCATNLVTETPPSLSLSAAPVVEGDAGTTNAMVVASLSKATSAIITVNFATQDGTAKAGEDYLSVSGTLTFQPGETNKSIPVLVAGDLVDEPDEDFYLVLTNAVNATLSASTARLLILDNDPTPKLSVNDVTVAEGNTGTVNATFTLMLSGPSANPVTVDFATTNGTALAGSDYLSSAGTITFPPGNTSQSLSVTVNGDTEYESDETFAVTLANGTNATLAKSSGVGIIENDDLRANQPPAISITNPRNQAAFPRGSNIHIEIEANDPDGNVVRAEFYSGATKLGESATSPYSLVWSNVAAGSYMLTAKATDNLGATAVSTPVSITVTNPAPTPTLTINIVSPPDRASFCPGTDIPITAVVSNAATVAKVEFYAGGTLLGIATAGPYHLTWTAPPSGDYSFTAKVTDGQGNTATSSSVLTTVSELCGDVAIVRAHADPEIDQMQDYLFQMGYSSQVFDQPGLTFAALKAYKLIIWDDLGRATDGLASTTVDALYQAFTNGIPLYLIGERLATTITNLAEPQRGEWLGLTHLNPAMGIGGDGVVQVRSTVDYDPILHGRFAAVSDFSYPPRVDLATNTEGDAEVVGTTGGADVLVAYPGLEVVDTGQTRLFTENIRLSASDGAGARDALRGLFQNVVCWLLRCPTCPDVDANLTASGSVDAIEAGQPLEYDLQLSQSGECEAVGAVVKNVLPSSVQFVGAKSEQGTWTFDPAANQVTFLLGHLAKSSTTDLRITVVPLQAGTITNVAGVTINGPEVHLDNNAAMVVTIVEGTMNSVAPRLTVRALPGELFEMRLTGQAGLRHEIQLSANLIDWISFTNAPADWSATFSISPPTSQPRRFFRAKVMP